MKTCAYCGRESDDAAAECRECGTKSFNPRINPAPDQGLSGGTEPIRSGEEPVIGCPKGVKRELSATQGWLPPVVALLALCLGFLWYLAASSAELPDRVATHFDFGGKANGWMSRQATVTFMGAMGVGLPLLLVSMASLVRVLPPSMINIPRRDYWLAPERRSQTAMLLFRHMLWLACLIVCFMGGIHYTLVRANQTVPPHMPSGLIWPMVAGFLVAIGVWIITLLRAFSIPRSA